MDGTRARLTGDSLVATEPKQFEISECPSLRLAGTLAYEGIDPIDERLGALRDACCLLTRLKMEAAALAVRSQQGRGDAMTVVSGQSGLDRAVDQLEGLIRSLDEAVLRDVEQNAGVPS